MYLVRSLFVFDAWSAIRIRHFFPDKAWAHSVFRAQCLAAKLLLVMACERLTAPPQTATCRAGSHCALLSPPRIAVGSPRSLRDSSLFDRFHHFPAAFQLLFPQANPVVSARDGQHVACHAPTSTPHHNIQV